MKVYISADIEGVTGIGHWDETEKSKSEDYRWFQEQMTAEVAAASEAAIEAGATEILIKDAHHTGRNLIPDRLPEMVKIIRGWSGHPLSMIQELDESFDAALFIGYHSRAGENTNPLAHTMSSSKIASMMINGKAMSEFYFHALAASYYKVPVVFLSGDQGLCEEVQSLNPEIRTVAVNAGVGDSVISIHPKKSIGLIRKGVRKSLAGNPGKCLLDIPEHIDLQVLFKRHQDAYKASFYPGARLLDPHKVGFQTDDYFEIMRFNLLAY